MIATGRFDDNADDNRRTFMDEPSIPPAEVLEVFLRIKGFVDSTVTALQEAADAADEAAESYVSKSATVVPLGVAVEVDIAMPIIATKSPSFTVEEVRMAQAWLEMANSAGKTIIAIGALESLLQFAERVLDIAK